MPSPSSSSPAPDPKLSGAGPVVLVVDDDPALRRLVGVVLESHGYRVEQAASGTEALLAIERHLPQLVLLDLHMPDVGGFDVLARLRASKRYVPVIILTADDDIPQVVRAMLEGARNYVVKPVAPDRLLSAVREALAETSRPRATPARPQSAGQSEPTILGASPLMRRLLQQIDRVAPSDVTVMLHGESGTGKELVARELHARSARAKGPFVAVNCASIAQSLQESELFGHEKGAFTGANERRIGRFEQANKGTLFLDEVAELSVGLQASLLRAIQERRFHRVGGSNEVTVDVRIVSATHVDLAQAADAGSFRKDLYFRLAVFEVELPALRERPEDILVLARNFVDVCAEQYGRAAHLAPETEATLVQWTWTGNVRELRNAIERAFVDAADGVIRVENLPRRMHPVGASEPALPAVSAPLAPNVGVSDARRLADLERQAIEESLRRHAGNIAAACRELGLSRNTIYRRLTTYGLR